MVAITRRAYRTRRVGHAGTLDPFATGLLVLLLGHATRLSRYLVGLSKEYAGVIRLGATTTTDDATGAVTHTSDAWAGVDDHTLATAMTALTGQRDQVPPAYSAKRVAGERAHRLARRGAPVALEPQRVDVTRFELVARRGPDLQFRTAVGSGTYVRSLARELGELLRCGAHLVELRRTTVGPFDVAHAIPLETVRQGGAALEPPLAALRHAHVVFIDPAARDRLAHGQAIPATEPGEGPIALVCEERLVAVARPEAGMWCPEVVLA